MKIHGKEYVEVKDRIKEFRKKYPEHRLVSEIVKVSEVECLIKAKILDKDNIVVATGHAYERADDKQSLVNKTSHVENCETSAWGRSLACFGIGIDGSIASVEEMQKFEKDNKINTFEQAKNMIIRNGVDLRKLINFCNQNYGNWNEIEREKMKNIINDYKIKFGEV